MRQRLIHASLMTIVLTFTAACGSDGEAPLGWNLDLHDTTSDLPDDYGAAAGVAGPWNGIGLGVNDMLTDTRGEITLVSATAAGAEDLFGPITTTDGQLIRDAIMTNNVGDFGLTISGLENGSYDVYYYANSTNPVMDFLVNGSPIPDLTGAADADVLGPEGGSWGVVEVLVTGGTIEIVNDTPVSLEGMGLSGLQIVRIE